MLCRLSGADCALSCQQKQGLTLCTLDSSSRSSSTSFLRSPSALLEGCAEIKSEQHGALASKLVRHWPGHTEGAHFLYRDLSSRCSLASFLRSSSASLSCALQAADSATRRASRTATSSRCSGETSAHSVLPAG